jgi:3-dehydroquinate synthase
MKFSIDTTRSHQCKVIVNKDLRSNLSDYIGAQQANCFVLIDEHVNQLYRSDLEKGLGPQFPARFVSIPPGEKSKSLFEFERLLDYLLENGVRRNSVVLAVGGGVTGDLSGFVAASVHRGLRLIHIPTTLLAMVDSSIGGKTGINHPSGKNLIGAFYQPESILIDPGFLDTLPAREWNCGFGEVLKYACISDPEIFSQVGAVSDWKQIPTLDELITRCARIKADIVMRDELETGERAFLNFGHTFAHALEQVTQFTRFAHGEAVYVGLVAATWLSGQTGARVDLKQLLLYRDLFKLDTNGLEGKIDHLIEVMHRDKKMSSDVLKLILLDSYGAPKSVTFSDYTLLKRAWSFSLQQLNCL